MNLTKTKLYAALFGVALSLSACEKDFLETEPSNAVSYDQAYGSKGGMEAALTGMYRLMRQTPVNQNAASSDTYGLPHLNLTFDVMGQDIMANTNWFIYQYELDNKNATYRGPRFLWGHPYNLITNANNIIANAQNVPDASEAERTAFEAEARAIRGLSYFNLARYFQHTYLKDKNALGVPLMLEPATPQTEGKERATLEEVYAQIVEDLTYAEANLTAARSTKSRINKNVAQGLLARVYLEMGEWEKAAEFAAKARAGYPLMSAAEYARGFNSYANAEWIWGLPQSADQNPIYGSFYSFIDGRYTVDDKGNKTYVRRGYNNIRANDRFVELFDANDQRRQFQEDVNAYNTTASGDKVWTPDRYTVTKFKDNADFGGHLVLMRAAEMLLIEAEAKAQLSMDGDAQALLLALRQNRLTDAGESAYTDNTGQDLLQEIYVERRKELYGEGFGLLDIKRLQMPLVREGNHTAVLGTTPANSNLFVSQIPQHEIDVNPKIEQNP